LRLLHTITTIGLIAVATLSAIGAVDSAVYGDPPNVIFDVVVVVVLSIFAWANWQDVKKPPTAAKLLERDRKQ
jgi:uncharacterized membrane protein YccC